MKAAATRLEAVLASGAHGLNGGPAVPGVVPQPSRPTLPAFGERFLAGERERWGQGSWRREHVRSEDPVTKERRAEMEQAQVEAQRRAAEAKLMQLRREKGVSADTALPPNVAKRVDIAPLGARAAAEEARRQKAAAQAQEAADELAARAAREASAASLAAAAAAKAAAMQPADLARVQARIESKIGSAVRGMADTPTSGGGQGAAQPVLPSTAMGGIPVSAPPAPSAAVPTQPRQRGGGYDDLRRRREADAAAHRQREAAAQQSSTAYTNAALHKEMEAEAAAAVAALAAAAAAAAATSTGVSRGAAPHVPLVSGPGVAQCNAPYALRREDCRLEISWTTGGAMGDDVIAFQLQMLPPLPGAQWVTLTDTVASPPLLLERLVPGTPYQMRVRAKSGEGTWGPYSAPAILTTTGVRPPQAHGTHAPGSAGAARQAQEAQQAEASGGEYEAMFMRTAAFMASGAASSAAAGAPGMGGATWASPEVLQTVENIADSLPADASAEQREAAMQACVAHVRSCIRAIRLSGLPPDRVRREMRAMRVRYHPDKALPHQHWLYAELSKLVNAETRE